MDVGVYCVKDWEHGLRCAACEREFMEGQPICERLDAMTYYEDEPAPIVVIVCWECDVTGRKIAE